MTADTPEARTEARPVCEGFAWIGQSFKICDACGQPYWWHTHERRSGHGPFDPQVLVPITAERAESCRRKWDR